MFLRVNLNIPLSREYEMPTVNGLHVNKITTVYETSKGIEAIKETIVKSKRLRITTIPPSLLKEIIPLLADKDIKILLLPSDKPHEKIEGITDVAITKSKLLADYKGDEMIIGSITSPAVSFNILWKDDKIYDISAMNYERCVRCQSESFEDTGWRFADKITEKIPAQDEKKNESKNHII